MNHRTISNEFLVQRYKQGVQLVKPSSSESILHHSVANLNQLPTLTYFLDPEGMFIKANSLCAEVIGAQSDRECIGKSVGDFSGEAFGHKVLAHDITVIKSKSMQVFEEFGSRPDDILIQALSFKYPWYQNDKIIGVFGFSLKMDPHSLTKIGNTISLLMATGLFDSASMTPSSNRNIYFSKREQDVLRHLVRGKTAKQIGIELFISKRTVERHIENIKIKSKCSSKSEVIDIFVDQFI